MEGSWTIRESRLFMLRERVPAQFSLEHTRISPVWDGLEVQVEFALFALIVLEDPAEPDKQIPACLSRDTVGVGGKGSALGQHIQAGEKAQCPVHVPGRIMGVPLGSNQLKGQEGKNGLDIAQAACVRKAAGADRLDDFEILQEGEKEKSSGALFGREMLVGYL